MTLLKSLGVMVVILILRGLLKLRGRKIISIKWYDEPAIEIPFENEILKK